MAIARYKAVKEFEYDGTKYGIGNALVLDPKDAQELIETGKVQLGAYLDPENETDAAEIARIKADPRTFKASKAPAPAVVADPQEGDACDLEDGTQGVLAKKRGKLVCVVAGSAEEE